MASKDTDDLLAQLDDITIKSKAPPTRTTTARPARQTPASQSQTEQDVLAGLDNLVQRPASRPETPSLRAPATMTASRSPNRTAADTPPLGQTAEDKSGNGQRQSGDSSRSTHQMFTPATTATDESPEPTPQPAPATAKSGGWWGGLLSTATTAISHAQAAVKDLQQNEEAQKWAEQVRGNVDALKGFGTPSLDSVAEETQLTSQSRRRTSLYGHPDLPKPTPDHRSSHLRPRTPTNTHYS